MLRAFVEFISDFDNPMDSSSKKKEMVLENGRPFRPDMFETILKMFTPDVPNSIHGRPRFVMSSLLSYFLIGTHLGNLFYQEKEKNSDNVLYYGKSDF